MSSGPGGADANGIWLYGEADVEGEASDLLNVGMQSVSDAIGSILDRLSRLESQNRQIDTTNDVITAGLQIGFGKITGSGNANASEAVTFPAPFTAVPAVFPSIVGVHTTGAFTLTGLSANDTTLATPGEPTTTGFTVRIRNTTGTLSNAFDYYYAWIALGPTS